MTGLYNSHERKHRDTAKRNERIVLMKGLYDIHCHILPGVDDGARNMEESLWMLSKEYKEGVRHVILTPHFRYGV